MSPREVLAEAVFEAARYAFEDGWIDPARLPEGDDPDDWDGDLPQWDLAADWARDNGYRMSDAGLAALRAKGWSVVRTDGVRDSLSRAIAFLCGYQHSRPQLAEDIIVLTRLEEAIR